ncbi:hypothetical protein HMPREF1594_03042 [Escherichia coli 907446]|nr:hypothetical protein HMPREF1594_03042 [Escherichia coli 907446]
MATYGGQFTLTKHFTTVNDHHPCSDSGCFREKNQLVAGDIMIIPSRSG